MINLPLETLLPLVAGLLAGGVVAGFLAGLFGIGGGGVLVPVLYVFFGGLGVDEAIRMHMSIGTALAVMIPTSLSSLRSHARRGNVDGSLIRRMAAPVVFGVVIGSAIAKVSTGLAIQLIWIFFASLMAAKQFVGAKSWRLGDNIPTSKLLEVYGVATGIISTLMSVGGGAYITTMMTLYGRPIQQAVGTSFGFGPIIALPGMLGFIWAGWSVTGTPPGSLGYVSLIGAACMVPASVLTAPVGARIAARFSRRALEIAFGVFLTVIALRFVYEVVMEI
ncbi:MAG: sulfite exporter TauE/SafE family protein [Pseudomonadota bacterium]